ncbi:MAG: hydrogenase [Bacteroidia bacterium]|nr:hydrogenase [Bacteroidia bacterium]
MIIKRNFNPLRVMGYVKYELAFACFVSLAVYLLHGNGASVPSIPFSVAAILGSALAIFIAFRNNSAYSRWWEARTQWGGIVNSSRVLARLIITFTDSHAHQANYSQERSEKFKREMIYLQLAWVNALRIQLRGQQSWEEIKAFLSDEAYQCVLNSPHKVNQIQLLQGRMIYAAMANGTLAGFDSFQLEGQLLSLANYQGACERIKNTPLLRQYDYFTRLFLYSFLFLLPFSLLSDFVRMEQLHLLSPVSILISFVFSIIAKVGEVNEDPFENRITDVPVTAICTTIERDLRALLGETNLPAKPEPKQGYLY